MENIIAIKDYLKKLQKVINFEHTFNFFGSHLVKKSKIDDIVCCIYAKLPDSYKKLQKSKVGSEKYSSILSYNILTKLLAQKFFLDKNLCIINVAEANKLIGSVLTSIERDIYNIQKKFDEE